MAPDAGLSSSAIARATAAVPPPGLLLVSIVSIQLGAAVAVNLFDALGPIGTTFLRMPPPRDGSRSSSGSVSQSRACCC